MSLHRLAVLQICLCLLAAPVFAQGASSQLAGRYEGSGDGLQKGYAQGVSCAGAKAEVIVAGERIKGTAHITTGSNRGVSVNKYDLEGSVDASGRTLMGYAGAAGRSPGQIVNGVLTTTLEGRTCTYSFVLRKVG